MPFLREDFLTVFERYNEAVWPAPVGWTILAFLVVVATLRRAPQASPIAASLLVALWAWTAVAYHWMHFTSISAGAWVFGAAFVVQAILVALSAIERRLCFGLQRGPAAWLGLVIVGYALVVYPMLGQLGDHAYPRSPSFGAPCPMVIFTLGMLLLTTQRVPKRLLVIPVLWAGLAFAMPIVFGIWEDLGLGIAALATVVALAVRDHVPRRAAGGTRIVAPADA